MAENSAKLVYCSGRKWEGNGSKETSTCEFGDSMKTTVDRYKCSHCATGQTPENILANADGIRQIKPPKALSDNDAVLQTKDDPVQTGKEMPVIEATSERETVETTVETEQETVETTAEIVPLAEATKPRKSKQRRRRRRF